MTGEARFLPPVRDAARRLLPILSASAASTTTSCWHRSSVDRRIRRPHRPTQSMIRATDLPEESAPAAAATSVATGVVPGGTVAPVIAVWPRPVAPSPLVLPPPLPRRRLGAAGRSGSGPARPSLRDRHQPSRLQPGRPQPSRLQPGRRRSCRPPPSPRPRAPPRPTRPIGPTGRPPPRGPALVRQRRRRRPPRRPRRLPRQPRLVRQRRPPRLVRPRPRPQRPPRLPPDRPTQPPRSRSRPSGRRPARCRSKSRTTDCPSAVVRGPARRELRRGRCRSDCASRRIRGVARHDRARPPPAAGLVAATGHHADPDRDHRPRGPSGLQRAVEHGALNSTASRTATPSPASVRRRSSASRPVSADRPSEHRGRARLPAVRPDPVRDRDQRHRRGHDQGRHRWHGIPAAVHRHGRTRTRRHG